jgi:hypothetical protein
MTDYQIFPLVITTVQTTENLARSIHTQAAPGYYGNAPVAHNTGGMPTTFVLVLEENQAANDYWQFDDGSLIALL